MNQKVIPIKKPIDAYIYKMYENGDDACIPLREINFSQEVEDYTVDVLLMHLNMFREIEPKKAVTVIVNSGGGEVSSCLKYYDFLRRFPFKVDSIVAGEAMSAATVMSIGTTGKRYITKNSALMIHEISSWPMGSLSKLKNRVKYAEELQSRIIQIYVQHTKIKSVSEWETIMANETYYSPKEALGIGLVDEIL